MGKRTAIVTGGSTGIGREICRAFLAQGVAVISLSRRPTVPDEPGMRSVEVDLSDPVATRRVAFELAAAEGATTIVHNAGAIREKPLERVEVEDLDALAHLHLAAPIALVQAHLPAMRAASFGRIVLISTRAVLGLANRTVYSATKAGMLGLARTWALELAGSGITVNVVAPGPIAETEMFDGVLPEGSPRREALARAIPVGRLGRPADVARAVSFFADPEAGFVTGQTLYVCGGTSVGSLVL
jgi:NAD(P)-dependent dehydrogenase (short-subunit alcohol dehydrogenase family)